MQNGFSSKLNVAAMNFYAICEAMKLKKRYIIICTVLCLIFVCQTLFFYSSPNTNRSSASDVSQEVVKVPIKINKTLVNVRNLFQGIMRHQQNVKNKNSQKLMTTLDASLSTTASTTTFKLIQQVNPSDIKDRLQVKRQTVETRDQKVVRKRDATRSNYAEVPFIRKEFSNRSIDEQHIRYNYTNNHTNKKGYANKHNTSKSSFRFYRENLEPKVMPKVKHPNLKENVMTQSSILRFDVDKDAFAAESNFNISIMNQQLPNRKHSDQNFKDDFEDDIKVKSISMTAASPEHNFWVSSIKDHRILGVDRNQLSRDEVLFGTLKPRNISRLRSEIKVVSMSLYGHDKRYMIGAVENAKLVKENFPGWKLRFYAEYPRSAKSRFGFVPQDIVDALRNLGADIHYIAPEDDYLPPMMWRFLVADDPSVDRFIVRDSDSRLTKRDFAATVAWMRSGQPFQCIRDHPSHAGQSISGGMWGGETHKLRIILKSSWTEAMSGQSSSYFTDMSFLQSHIWPKVTSHVYCSDSVSCDRWPNSFPFPVRRYGYDHVGEVYDERGIGRRGDIAILQRQGENERCLTPLDY